VAGDLAPVRLGCLFVLIPIGEIFLLVKLALRMGVGPVLAGIALTAALGFHLIRSASQRGLTVLQTQTARGEDPRSAWTQGLVKLTAGALLLTPGVMTDALGLLVLFPPTRSLLGRWVLPRIAAGFRGKGGVTVAGGVFWTPSPGSPPIDPDASPPARPGEIVQ